VKETRRKSVGIVAAVVAAVVDANATDRIGRCA